MSTTETQGSATTEAAKKVQIAADDGVNCPEVGDVVAAMDWSHAEERRIILKLDCYLMPLLLLAFFFLCLDRSNISSALTDTLLEDLHITVAQATLGNQLQLAGIIIFEIPSTMILQIVGAQRWLVCQMLAWGLVAAFQSFITNKSSYYATRFLLGVFEGGFIPGAMVFMASFYTRTETSPRFAIYYFGNYISSGTSSLIAAGILQMEGVRGWAGWRWLFMIDGAMTFLFALVLLLLLPKSPDDTRPLHKLFDLFSPRERHIIRTKLLLDDASKDTRNAPRSTLKDFLKVFRNGRLWMHFIINLVGLIPAGGIQVFAPTIIKHLGFAKTKANALTSVGYYCAVILALSLGFFAKTTKRFGLACVLPFAWSCIFSGALYGADLAAHPDKWTLYALLTMVIAAMLIVQPINNAWCSDNSRSTEERSIGLAMCVIGSNLGGLIGQQLFQASDAPKYKHGFTGVFAIYVAVLVIVLTQILQYWWSNKRLDRKQEQQQDDVERDEPISLRQWRYIL